VLKKIETAVFLYKNSKKMNLKLSPDDILS